MAFTRGKYGVEHNRRPIDEKSHGLRWLFVLLGVLLVVSFAVARLFMQQPPARIETVPRPPAPVDEPADKSDRPVAPPADTPRAPAPDTPKAAPQPKPTRTPPAPPDPQASRDAAKLLDTVRQRPAAERVLLEKLAAAERQGDVVVAIDISSASATGPPWPTSTPSSGSVSESSTCSCSSPTGPPPGRPASP